MQRQKSQWQFPPISDMAALFALMQAAMDETSHEALPVQTRHQAAAENNASYDLDLDSDPLDDMLGPDYDFPQTNFALPDPDDQNQTVADEDAVVAENAVPLTADQKKDPSLAPLWQTADQHDSDIVTASGVLHRCTTDQTGEPY